MQKSPFISVYRLLQLFFISILLVSLNSCQNENLLTNEDEDEITHTNVTAETHDTEDEACRLVPEFCKETNDTQLGIIGNDPKAGILVTIGDENFQVFPIELFKNSKELVVRKGEELFILSTNKNEYYTSNSSDYQLPSQLSNLFKLDFEKIINQKLSIEEIANSSGGTVKEVLGSRKSIDFTNSNPPPSTLSTITTEYCTIRFVANVQNYVNEFAYGGYITNISNLTSATEEAFEFCPEIYPENFCNDCKDPVCIIDNLSENSTISDIEESVIKANYLRLLMGLSDNEYNWLVEENRENIGDLYEFSFTCESIEVLKSEFFIPLYKVCSSSFDNYTNTGTGGTIQIECIKNSTYWLEGNIFIGFTLRELCYEFPDMCIDVGSLSLEDPNMPVPLDEPTRKRLTAKAFDKAFKDFNKDVRERDEDGLPPLSQPDAATAFKNKLSNQLNILISDADVASGPCQGPVGLGRLFYQLWEGGLCVGLPCEC